MSSKSSYRPPREMLNNIARGEDLKKRWGRGGKGVAGSTEGASAGLADGAALSLIVVKNVKSFFDGHPDSFKPDDLEKDGGPNEATVDWLLWGGTAGKKWSDNLVEKFIDEDLDNDNQFTHSANILKVDDTLGLVIGWAIISKQEGADYFDCQGDHIPEDAMLKAATDFMQSSRVVGDMHEKDEGGQVVFAFPMTTEIAKAFGITTKSTGLMIGIKPKDQKTLEKYKNGTYTGFSIGGVRVDDDLLEA